MNKIVLVYLVVAGLLAGKVVSTIYQGSMVVNHGSKIAELQREKQTLEKRELELKKSIAQSTSIESVASTPELAGFEKIVSPLVVAPSTAVATNL